MERRKLSAPGTHKREPSPAQVVSMPRLVRVLSEQGSMVSLKELAGSERREFYALIARALQLVWQKLEERAESCAEEGVRYVEDDTIQGFHIMSEQTYRAHLETVSSWEEALRTVFSHHRGLFFEALEEDVQKEPLFSALRGRMNELMQRHVHLLSGAREPEDEIVSGFMTARTAVISLALQLPKVVETATGSQPDFASYLRMAMASEATLARLASLSLSDFLRTHRELTLGRGGIWPAETFSLSEDGERIELSSLVRDFLEQIPQTSSSAPEGIGCPALFAKLPQGGNVIFDVYRRF